MGKNKKGKGRGQFVKVEGDLAAFRTEQELKRA